MPHHKTKVHTHGCKLTVTLPNQVQEEAIKKPEVVPDVKKVETDVEEVKVSLDTMHDPVTGNNYTSVNGGCFALRR